jgi:hypothetical protein
VVVDEQPTGGRLNVDDRIASVAVGFPVFDSKAASLIRNDTNSQKTTGGWHETKGITMGLGLPEIQGVVDKFGRELKRSAWQATDLEGKMVGGRKEVEKLTAFCEDITGGRHRDVMRIGGWYGECTLSIRFIDDQRIKLQHETFETLENHGRCLLEEIVPDGCVSVVETLLFVKDGQVVPILVE